MERYVALMRQFWSQFTSRAYWSRLNVVYIGALYLIFAIIITWPLLPNIDSYVTGRFFTDLPRTAIFSFWWIKMNILERHLFPLKVDVLNYPTGGYLYAADPMTSLMGIVLDPFFSFPVDYNLILFFNIVGGALAGYFLVKYLTKNQYAGLVGGTIIGFCPNRFSTYIDGVSEFGHLMWVPLYFLYLYRLYDEEGRDLDNVLSTGILLFIATFANWYYGLYALIVSGALFLYKFFLDPETREHKMLVLRKTVLAIGVGMFLLLPFVLAQFFTTTWGINPERTEALVNKSTYHRGIQARRNAADMKEFFSRGPGELKDRFFPHHHMVYLGYVAILLSILGLVAFRKSKHVVFWCLAGLVFLILTMGPTLVVNGTVYPIWAMLNKCYLNVFGFMCKFVPGVKSSNHPYRFAIITSMALAVLGGFGVAYLTGFLRTDLKKTAVAVLLSWMVLLEFSFLSPLPHPFPHTVLEKPLLYRTIARDKEVFGILDVPFGILENKEYGCKFPSILPFSYYVTVHNKPLPYSLEGIHPSHIEGNAFMKRLLIMSKMINQTDEKVFLIGSPQVAALMETENLPDSAIFEDIEKLRGKQYRYVIVHKNLIPDDMFNEFTTFLTRFLGEPVKHRDRWIYII